MDEQKAIKKSKFERTTQEQLQFFTQYCREHPELLAGKNNPLAPRALQEMWEEVADNLNALRGATRTAAKWKESLAHWKSQLRSRARKVKANAIATGGGPRSEQMSEFEQQAIETFGAAAVDGFEEVEVLGFQTLTNPSPASNIALISTVNDESMPPMQDENTNPNVPLPPSARNKNSNLESALDIALMSLKKKDEQEELARAETAKRDQQVIEQQERMITALNAISQSCCKISQTLDKFCEKLEF